MLIVPFIHHFLEQWWRASHSMGVHTNYTLIASPAVDCVLSCQLHRTIRLCLLRFVPLFERKEGGGGEAWNDCSCSLQKRCKKLTRRDLWELVNLQKESEMGEYRLLGSRSKEKCLPEAGENEWVGMGKGSMGIHIYSGSLVGRKLENFGFIQEFSAIIGIWNFKIRTWKIEDTSRFQVGTKRLNACLQEGKTKTCAYFASSNFH